ncbi:MAG: WD40/YVTN/BNR-like repeat-containing protein [Pirellulaceae bacterium]
MTALQFSCDDPLVAWLVDSGGLLFMTLDGGRSWRNMSAGLIGGSVQNIVASSERTFVLWANTDRGVFITRDGGMSWREAPREALPEFQTLDFSHWQKLSGTAMFRIDDDLLVKSLDGAETSRPAMQGWRTPIGRSVFGTPWGIIASGPSGCYRTSDGETWEELKLWPEKEIGAADFLHAYWMGRYSAFFRTNTSSRSSLSFSATVCGSLV